MRGSIPQLNTDVITWAWLIESIPLTDEYERNIPMPINTWSTTGRQHRGQERRKRADSRDARLYQRGKPCNVQG